jgi:hypothetical protein
MPAYRLIITSGDDEWTEVDEHRDVRAARTYAEIRLRILCGADRARPCRAHVRDEAGALVGVVSHEPGRTPEILWETIQ